MVILISYYLSLMIKFKYMFRNILFKFFFNFFSLINIIFFREILGLGGSSWMYCILLVCIDIFCIVTILFWSWRWSILWNFMAMHCYCDSIWACRWYIRGKTLSVLLEEFNGDRSHNKSTHVNGKIFYHLLPN